VFDQRLIDARNLEEISVGDYVLSGGEIASLAVLDACVRLLPGVLGSEEGLEEESFTKGLLEYPLYTQPREWKGKTVPEVLLSGHHGDIKTWQREQAEMVTRDRRPDLWARYLERS
jgi:tRNA (guanine37-N1)-methyltransferase